jgi:hypothetical protein
MRIRIALIAAMTVALVMSIMMSFSTYAGVADATTAPHGTGTHRATAHLTAVERSTGNATPTAAAQPSRRAGSAFPSGVLSAQLQAHTAFAAAALPSFTPPPPPPPPPPTDATSTATADWQCIRTRESGDEYNNPAEPSGAYGILLVTWQSNGYSGWPYEAPAATQDALALKLYHEYGWAPWSSRYACGL